MFYMNKQFSKTLSLCMLMLCVFMAPASEAGATPTVRHRIGNLNVTVTFYSPSIVVVTKTVVDGPQPSKSYSVIMTPQKGLKVSEAKANDDITLASSAIRVSLNTKNGKISLSMHRVRHCCLIPIHPWSRGKMLPIRESMLLPNASNWTATKPSMASGSCVTPA